MGRMAKRKRTRTLKDYLVPHRGNRYKPALFAKEAVVAFAVVLFIVEVAYLAQVKLVLKAPGFLATVLPAALTTLANSDRAMHQVPAVTEDPALDKVAQAKANDMAAKGYFAHVSPDGSTPWDWLDRAGYSYSYAGENLAVDFTDSTDVETAWMHSPLHRANILKQEYTKIGIGVAQGMYEGKEVTFVAEFFATPPSDLASVQPAGTPIAQAAAKPTAQDVAAKTPATQPVETAVPAVLGEAAAPKPAPVAQAPALGDAAVLSTSPATVLWYVLAGVAALFALLAGVMLAVHARKKVFYAELSFGALTLIAMVLGVMFYNATPLPQVPHDTQAATAALPF